MSINIERGYKLDRAQKYRQQFPALSRIENGRPVVFFDGPGGTQVPQRVADQMNRYLLEINANHGGLFGTSRESGQMLHEAHQAFADFVGCSDCDEIIFGQNMTSLTFAFSRAIANTWSPGDQIVVTALDHDANITPWLMAARDAKVDVRWVEFSKEDYTLNVDEFQNVLTDRTRLVAVGCASNATGGINPVKKIAELAHAVGALVYLDAVHYGPHGLIDVVDWDCDFLTCSAYKFFGPHMGMLWGRKQLMESYEAYRVRPAGDQIPEKWMTGTQSHESLAGGIACIDYLAEIGRDLSGNDSLGRREALRAAFEGIGGYEQELSHHLISALSQIDGLKIWGIDDLGRLDERFPTVSITHPNISTTRLARELADHGINVWHGNYYAVEFTQRLGLEPEGMVRIGLVHYNTVSEIDRLIEVIKTTVASQ